MPRLHRSRINDKLNFTKAQVVALTVPVWIRREIERDAKMRERSMSYVVRRILQRECMRLKIKNQGLPYVKAKTLAKRKRA